MGVKMGMRMGMRSSHHSDSEILTRGYTLILERAE